MMLLMSCCSGYMSDGCVEIGGGGGMEVEEGVV